MDMSYYARSAPEDFGLYASATSGYIEARARTSATPRPICLGAGRTERPAMPCAVRRQPLTRGDEMLGEPNARTLLARTCLCLRPKELCMLLSQQFSTLNVVEKHPTLLRVSLCRVIRRRDFSEHLI